MNQQSKQATKNIRQLVKNYQQSKQATKNLGQLVKNY